MTRLVGTCNVTGCDHWVIQNFKHKGLEKFFLKGIKAGIQIKHESRLRLIPGRLHAATSPQDMGLPGLYFHELKGKRRGRWAVRVSGNWRITFKFDGPHAIDVDYEDYH